ncbi:SGNH/GDSL hydrolase family protein [Nocardiopsis sp. NRRL B-16309]|uniref:SGNH/GDSL hydrolase family protein n=1 Tax=Nocardiopsis sp. NRRL B-16309 TaxID=1519494 RepID=UPI0006AF4AE7|nr:SGNH/GDSL hydrolase family protein [Nocardiopsis sp. NRRL B-16309]
MSERGDDGSGAETPENPPGSPSDDARAGDGARAGDHAPAEEPARWEEPATTDGSGADGAASAAAEPRRPRGRRRARIALIASAVLVLSLIVTLVVPPARDGLVDLWCEVTDGVCPVEELPPITEDEDTDPRVRMEPEEAALWGNYVALGDSYSSGDGAGDYDPATAEPGGCWRSEHAYSRLIEQEFDFAGALGFYACSSHRATHMLEQIGTPESQIERVTEHTSLVTLGIGGNDLGFIPVLRTCIVRMPLLENGACQAQEGEIGRRLDAFEEDLAEVLGEIRDRAPDARVLVLGYPRLFPEEPLGMYYTLTVSDQEWLNGIGQGLNERIRDVVYEVDGRVYGQRQTGSVEFVNTYSAFNGYEVNADESWLNGIVLGQFGEGLRVDRASFHPTAQGQMSIADRVRQQIEEGPERVLYVSPETLATAEPDQLAAELGGPLAPVIGPPAPGSAEDGE